MQRVLLATLGTFLALSLGACSGAGGDVPDAAAAAVKDDLPREGRRGDTPSDAGNALTEAEVRAFYAPLDASEGALDAERACAMLARAFEGRFETRHPDGATTHRVVGRDQTCADARAGATALRGTLEKGSPPEVSHDVEAVTIAADGASADARYVQRFLLPGQLEIVVRGTDTVIREDGRLVVRRSVGQEMIRNP